MKNLGKLSSRIRPSTVIAALALFIVIGGTATAASGLINGKKIKPGTVTAKQIKNKTITTAKLAPATVNSLKGSPGPAGPAGAPGPQGQAGAPGLPGTPGRDGVVAPLSDSVIDAQLGGDSVILELDQVSGDYLITAKANLTGNGNYPDGLSCSIWTDETHGVDSAGESPTAAGETVSLSMMAVASVSEKIQLRCEADLNDGSGSLREAKLIAVPIQG